jgi:hypothetical protein
VSKGEKTLRKLPRNLPRNLLTRLLKRPRKALLWLMHQTQNCMQSIRLTTRKPSLLQRPPKTSAKATATKMFQFYANLLSADAKYAWNKIVKEQMEADPFKDLQGMSKKGPRGLIRESFNNCVMIHLLTVFLNNVAKQEKCYLSNMLKKPQRVGIRQFVQCVEQHNAYVAQLPCWYYSPGYNLGMTLANLPLSEAGLACHDLWMCPHQWQDQYNLQEKRMTPVDMHSLQASLETIKQVCMHVVGRLDIVPYIRTFVQYDGTFGAPD